MGKSQQIEFGKLGADERDNNDGDVKGWSNKSTHER